MSKHLYEIKQTIRDVAWEFSPKTRIWENTFAITLLMKNVEHNTKLDEVRATESINFFWERFDRFHFRYQANDKRSECINMRTILERTPSGCYRHHILLRKPIIYNAIDFEQLFLKYWKEAKFSGSHSSLQEISSVEGWNDYLTNDDRHGTQYLN